MFAKRVDILRFLCECQSAACTDIRERVGLGPWQCAREMRRLKSNGSVRSRGIGPWTRWMLTTPADPLGHPGPTPRQD